MEVPYRRAWERLQEIETRLGFPLLETEVGGEGGGGARLTSRAEELIDRFQRLVNGMDVEIAERFERAFGTPPEAALAPANRAGSSQNRARADE
jgi:molybdate transport system regulatory protein